MNTPSHTARHTNTSRPGTEALSECSCIARCAFESCGRACIFCECLNLRTYSTISNPLTEHHCASHSQRTSPTKMTHLPYGLLCHLDRQTVVNGLELFFRTPIKSHRKYNTSYPRSCFNHLALYLMSLTHLVSLNHLEMFLPVSFQVSLEP